LRNLTLKAVHNPDSEMVRGAVAMRRGWFQL
jgi:hypothetical protein